MSNLPQQNFDCTSVKALRSRVDEIARAVATGARVFVGSCCPMKYVLFNESVTYDKGASFTTRTYIREAPIAWRPVIRAINNRADAIVEGRKTSSKWAA